MASLCLDRTKINSPCGPRSAFVSPTPSRSFCFALFVLSLRPWLGLFSAASRCLVDRVPFWGERVSDPAPRMEEGGGVAGMGKGWVVLFKPYLSKPPPFLLLIPLTFATAGGGSLPSWMVIGGGSGGGEGGEAERMCFEGQLWAWPLRGVHWAMRVLLCFRCKSTMAPVKLSCAPLPDVSVHAAASCRKIPLLEIESGMLDLPTKLELEFFRSFGGPATRPFVVIICVFIGSLVIPCVVMYLVLVILPVIGFCS